MVNIKKLFRRLASTFNLNLVALEQLRKFKSIIILFSLVLEFDPCNTKPLVRKVKANMDCTIVNKYYMIEKQLFGLNYVTLGF